METNESKIYEEKYKNGYGHSYPESHIIRIYERFLKKKIPLVPQPKILDYGCGTGANLLFFKNNGFNTYGCDVSYTAIDICKNNKSFNKEQFTVCNEIPNLIDLYEGLSFDLILSNQTLYYLSDVPLRRFIDESYRLMKNGGLLVATMMAKSHWFYSQKISKEGTMHTINLTNSRFKQLSYINFKEKDELENLFYPFQKCLLGFYTLDLLPDEGPSDHWIYIGQKVD